MIYQYRFSHDSETIGQAWRWALANIGHGSDRWYYSGDLVFHFREECDYIMFLLRWAS